MNIITSVSFKEVERVTHEDASVKGNYLNVSQDFSRDEIIPEKYRNNIAYFYPGFADGGVLPMKETLARSKNGKGENPSIADQKELSVLIKNNPKKFGIYCCRARFKHGEKGKKKETKVRWIMMIDKIDELKKTNYKFELKKTHESNLVCKAIERNCGNPIAMYKALNELKVSRRTKERIIAKLRENAERYGLEFFKDGKDGRVLMVRKLVKSTRQAWNAPLYKETKEKEESINTVSCRISKNQEKGSVKWKPSGDILGLIFWLSREIKKKCFWDNVKVKDNPGMRHRYVEDGVMAGIEKGELVRCFDEALHQRHGDATDMGLNCGMPTFKFELSSTVSLAREMLGIPSTRPKYKRQEAVKQKVEVEAVQAAFQKWKKEREDQEMKKDAEYQIYRQLPIDGISSSNGYMIDGSGYTAAASEVKPELDKETEYVTSLDWGNEIFGSDWL